MKRLLLSLIVAIAILLLQIEGDLAAMEKITHYQLTYQTENVTGQIVINGFVITDILRKTGNGTAALNPWLIGENELKVELKKADASKPAEFSFGLTELSRGDTISTMDRGKLFSIELRDKDFGVNGKASATKKFTSSLNFKPHLSAEPGQVKESDVLAYAQKFFALFIKKDAEGILRESEVKISDYSKAFGGVDMKAELRAYLSEELFKAKLNKLNQSALRAVAVGPTKSIWHVFNGKDELIKAKSTDGSTMELSVYIGLLDGKLKVIR